VVVACSIFCICHSLYKQLIIKYFRLSALSTKNNSGAILSGTCLQISVAEVTQLSLAEPKMHVMLFGGRSDRAAFNTLTNIPLASPLSRSVGWAVLVAWDIGKLEAYTRAELGRTFLPVYNGRRCIALMENAKVTGDIGWP